ncbi:MAG: hypothetical protein IT210_11735 [Armatimonadetes bacterium]|nr:hypothetical protein [Armatimonadota bacterium]
MEWLQNWQPGAEHLLCGAFGGLVSALGQTGGVLVLPQVVVSGGRKGLALGFVSAVAIGAFVGYVVDRHPVMSGAGGYAGIKLLDWVVGKVLPGLAAKEEDDAEEVASGATAEGGAAKRARRDRLSGEDL